MLADLRGHLFAYGTWEKLAQDANLSVTTVVRLAHGTTEAPHFSTVFKLLATLGRLNELEAVFHCENPVSAAEAARRKNAGA